MMRAYKTLFTLFVVSTALVCAPTMVDALTDFSTYTLQRNATGAGPNITVAKTKAHEAFQAAIAEIEASLPLNHFIIDITITAEGPVLPTIYTINYEVLIYVDCDVPSGGDPDIG